jgi:hypothetical protein
MITEGPYLEGKEHTNGIWVIAAVGRNAKVTHPIGCEETAFSI